MKKIKISIIVLGILLFFVGCDTKFETSNPSTSKDELIEENDRLNAKINDLKDNNTKLNEKVNEIENNNIKLTDENDELKVNLEINSKKMSELESRIKNLKKEHIKDNNLNLDLELLKNDEITNLVQNAHNIYIHDFFLERFKYSLSEYENFSPYTNINSGEKLTYKYYLVTEEGIEDIKGLKNFLSQYYTYEAINDFLRPQGIGKTNILYNGMYIEYDGKLYSSEGGGIGTLADKKIIWEDAKFELCGVLENETEAIYKMILPIAYYDEGNENIEKIENYEKFIRLKKDQNGLWKLNDLIKLEFII